MQRMPEATHFYSRIRGLVGTMFARQGCSFSKSGASRVQLCYDDGIIGACDLTPVPKLYLVRDVAQKNTSLIMALGQRVRGTARCHTT